MSQASRRKGARAEVELANELQRLLGDETIQRNLDQYQDGGRDLRGDSLADFHIEIKRRGSPSELRLGLWARTTELAATADTDQPRVPVIIARADGMPWRAYPCLTLEQLADFIAWYNNAYRNPTA